MMSRFKKIIRKIPILASPAKVFYDWRQERILRSRISRLLKANALPFSKEAPPKYSVGYEPTIRCNLRCKMCYQAQTRSLRRNELEPAKVLSVFEKLKDKIKSIKLVGGEPFVREDIFEMISFWDRVEKKVVLQTNCTLIDEKIVEKLKNYRCVTDILTSLDGPPEIHDAIRGVPGTFVRLKNAMSLIKNKMPNVRLTAFATLLISDNLDKLNSLIDTSKELGINSLNILFEQVYLPQEVEETRKIFKNIFGWEGGAYRLNTQTRQEIFPAKIDAALIKKKLAEAARYGLKKSCVVNFVPLNYFKNLEMYFNGSAKRSFCLKLLSPELRINQEGDVIWCDVIEKSFGNLIDKTPDEIWLSQDYQKFREYLFKNSLPICRRCCKAIYLV